MQRTAILPLLFRCSVNLPSPEQMYHYCLRNGAVSQIGSKDYKELEGEEVKEPHFDAGEYLLKSYRHIAMNPFAAVIVTMSDQSCQGSYAWREWSNVTLLICGHSLSDDLGSNTYVVQYACCVIFNLQIPEDDLLAIKKHLDHIVH